MNKCGLDNEILEERLGIPLEEHYYVIIFDFATKWASLYRDATFYYAT